jgi:hypothetical protein
MNDEIITEVRAIKDAIGAKFNYDLRALYEDIKRGEAELEARGINLIPPPPNPTSLPNTALQRNRFARR